MIGDDALREAIIDVLGAEVLDRDAIADAINERGLASGGRTPRDAVADPVGRDDVARLLDSFRVPDDSDIGAMDPRR